MLATSLRELERRVDALAPRPSRRRAASTGISRLDAILPEGGLPRGRAIEWLGPRSCGKTALLRAAFTSLHGAGEPVAIIDGAWTLYAPDWEMRAGVEPFWIIRPPRERDAVWCADLLLRSGAFGAVALETGDARSEDAPSGAGRSLSRNVIVRLQRLAEESGTIFVVVGSLSLAALRLRFRPGRLDPVGDDLFGPRLPALRPVWVGVEKGRTEEIPVLCPTPPVRTVRPRTRDRKGPP